MFPAGFPTTPQASLAGFISWVYGVMGVPTAWLPSDSQALYYAFNTAVATVHPAFITIPGPIYLQMCYNLGGHLLATWAADPTPYPGNPPAPFITVDSVGYGYFQYLRKQNNMLGFVTGIISASSDEGTSATMVVPKQAENLTISQLQLTTTPWGRTYLGYAQDYGTNWGLT